MIVLHTTKVGESSIVIHCLSREYGRRSFIVKGLGKKTGSGLLLPMNIVEAEILESGKSDLRMARKLSSAANMLGIRNDLYKNSICMFLSEVLFRTIKDGALEEGLYEWCRGQILLLEALKGDFSNFHLRFLLEFCVALGFSPSLDSLSPFFKDTNCIKDFLVADFASSMLIPLNGAARNEIAEGLLRYLEFHSETSLHVNSLRVLREIFI